jgi:hypothetical protein
MSNDKNENLRDSFFKKSMTISHGERLDPFRLRISSMNEENTPEKKVDQEVMDSGGKTDSAFHKTKNRSKAKTPNCRGCEKREDALRKIAVMGGKAVAGLGTGVCLGVGVLSVAAVAEVALPVILTFKALGVTCGALGLVKGAKEFNK